MQLYAGLDLHSRNTYIGIMDKEFKRVFGKRVVNKLPVSGIKANYRYHQRAGWIKLRKNWLEREEGHEHSPR
jgi:hypothetical protein